MLCAPVGYRVGCWSNVRLEALERVVEDMKYWDSQTKEQQLKLVNVVYAVGSSFVEEWFFHTRASLLEITLLRLTRRRNNRNGAGCAFGILPAKANQQLLLGLPSSWRMTLSCQTSLNWLPPRATPDIADIRY